MPSEVSIVNHALGLIGDDVILSLGDDSKRARLGSLLYADTRDAVLRAHPWNFALARAQLGRLAAAPAFGYAYQYQLPSDPYCLRVLSLSATNLLYAVEGRVLLTNESTASIRYIARLSDPAQFDPLFVEALSTRLASEMAYALTGNAELVKVLSQVYGDKLAEAAQRDAAEGTTQPYQGESSFTGLDICNQALGEIGLEAFLASDGDTMRARLCRSFYDATRQAVLRAHPWNFAIKRATFSATTAPAYDWTYAFTLPTDCLRVLDTETASDDFVVEGRTLLTQNGAPLKARYIANITDTTTFDALFTDALIARLSARLALPLTQKPAMAEVKWAEYHKRLAEARAMDGLEGTPLVTESNDLLEVR